MGQNIIFAAQENNISVEFSFLSQVGFSEAASFQTALYTIMNRQMLMDKNIFLHVAPREISVFNSAKVVSPRSNLVVTQ